MNHVLVETNFVVDVLRPFPAPAAAALLARVGNDVQLHVPWVALAEAKRTLLRIIREDLGFIDMMERFAVRDFKAGNLTTNEKPVVDQLAKRASDMRALAIQNATTAVDGLAARCSVIEPSKSVIERTLTLFPVKSLKPFDEMMLGAVLTRAAELKAAGEARVFFCDLNTKDFAPTNQALVAEYGAAGITYLPTFVLP